MNQRVISNIVLGFDIETIKNMDMVNKLPKPTVKYGNTKDSAKRKVLEEKAKDEQISKMALNPFFGRICSYAFYGKDYNGKMVSDYAVIQYSTDEEEIKLISKIFLWIKANRMGTPLIITWNGTEFDLRYVYIRAAILGVPVPSGVQPYSKMCQKFNNELHVDLMTTVCSWGKFEKLDTAGKVFLGAQKVDIDVTKFHDMIEAGKQKEIGIYNLQDAKLTYDLYTKIKPYFLNIY